MAVSLSQCRHQKFHLRPEVPVVPYLTLPFSSKHTDYTINQGWVYNKEEFSIHGYRIHGAIDYTLPYGTDVLASCDGYAMSSYFSFPLHKTHQGKEIYFGLGYFVMMYVPEVNRIVTYGHLSAVADMIPFSVPLYDKEKNRWEPTNHQIRPELLVSHPAYVFVKRGQKIGEVGFSGVRWGYEEYTPGATRPTVPDPEKYTSYDEPHIHFEDAIRDWDTGRKIWQRDPYDVYLTARNYPTHSLDSGRTSFAGMTSKTNIRYMGENPLFLLDKNGLPLFADHTL